MTEGWTPGGSPTAGPEVGPPPVATVTAPLAERFRGHLAATPGLVPIGSRLLLALSGGADSTALLHLLLDVAGARRLELHAAHFDHAVRPRSARDAERVLDACERLGVPARVGRAGGLGRGQAELRAARYRFLRAEADRVEADRIALAHQRDDQVETVLFRLGRGTGLRGLAGIPARRGRVVRPLLPFGRDELAAYLDARGVAWLRDPSNRDRRYARPRVRHDLLPALRDVAGPGVDARLLALADAAGIADGALDRRARRIARELAAPDSRADGLQIARSELAAYDRSERARVLRILARRLGFRLSRGGTRVGVEFIKRGRSGSGVDLADGLELRREFDRLLLRRPPDPEPDRELTIATRAPGAGRVRLGGREYEVRWGRDARPGEWTTSLSLPTSRFPLRIRAPRPGDRIRTRAGTKKLKKLFVERRVPRSHRRGVPVLETADGRVRWVAGLVTDRTAGEDAGEERFVIGVSDLRPAV